MTLFHPLDWIALAVFVFGWALYSWLVDFSPWRERTLTAVMQRQRKRWMETMLKRDVRIVDTAIIGGLQNGTAFFASTSLLAIGAAFALLTTSDEILVSLRDVAPASGSRAAWEVKSLGLLSIYAYAFFKFGWAYRLFNYASILMGATPPASESHSPAARLAMERATAMNSLAGFHFTRGQRAFFFSVAFLGWFASAWLFLGITIAVVVALLRRQFAFPALSLLGEDRDPHPPG
jgi:uncharacterized membrane protein